MADLLVWTGNSIYFSFGFRRALTIRETTDVVFLLSLVEGFDFRLGLGCSYLEFKSFAGFYL